ncbi:MAG TPA: acyltransferase family protein [Nocardioides sp.]|uniref:acyltransferase family protein n=1 Tax=Nocardioides sp. TaxID=35761 RepID=UPI002E36A23C|nr:acyltransferase family protein [Nocardioides sp.]HEX5090121.1 acyltransferase family protein [Nocardioides sp.]
MANELRGDIQGLRAVAVLVVIAAHAGVPFLRGGFVGVDVFFVISGYLIAGLLYREVLLTGQVSIGAFWARRARRILPAATLVTVVTVLLSLAWMSLVDAREVVVDALWACAFAANIRFAQQGVDYFATIDGVGPSPLQHYWSLGAEEQFYLAWPLLLTLCLVVTALLAKAPDRRAERLPRRAVLTMLAALTLASLLWSVHATLTSPATAYFSTLTRAWELGVGAMVALLPPPFLRRLTRLSLEIMAVTGVVVLLAACMLISEDTPFPGIAAVLPVAATAMLIVAGGPADVPGRRTRTSRVLAVAPMRVVGDWSYSLYLWHWPAFVLAPIAVGRALTGFEKGLTVLVVITLSAYTYRFVEQPFRAGRPAHRLSARRRALSLYPASAALVAVTAAGAWWWTGFQGGEHGDNPPITVAGAPIDGLQDSTEALVRASVAAARAERAVPSNLTPDLLNLRSSIADVGDCDYEDNVRSLCPHGDGDQTVVVVGDSHARAWIPAFDRIVAAGDWTAYYLVKPQCTAAHVTIASLGSDQPFTDCTDFQRWVVDQVDALHPELVVVASSPPVNGVFEGDKRRTAVGDIVPLLRGGYDDLFRQLGRYAGRVALIRDVPKSPDDPATCLTSGNPSLGDCMFEPVERSTVLGDVAVDSAYASGIEVVDPTPWLCYQGECPTVIGGTLSYRDTDHITTEYAANLWAELGNALTMGLPS